jgi:hypothetical protein
VKTERRDNGSLTSNMECFVDKVAKSEAAILEEFLGQPLVVSVADLYLSSFHSKGKDDLKNLGW